MNENGAQAALSATGEQDARAPFLKEPGLSKTVITLRVISALGLPLLITLLVGWGAGWLTAVNTSAPNPTAVVPLLATLGIVSWFLGLRWYGLAEMGLRGRRPLFAGIGFAVLGWVALLLIRFAVVVVSQFGTGFREFVLLLLFEGFAVQLWSFGLLFHALADWRGPLTAAFGSGILFGMAAFLLFQQPTGSGYSALLYFGLWGVLYGLIRLRTGSLLGTALIQAIQSFTVWVVLRPTIPPDPQELATMHWLTAVSYALIIWRLWPKQRSDYRI